MSFNFTFWLLFLSIASGVIYLIDLFFFQRKRLKPYKAELKKLSKKEKRQFYKNHNLKAPLVADYARSLFGVFVAVFIIRTFLIGNFLIPTASMTPTLPVGDFIFVDKTAYGVRAPFSNNVLIPIGEPKRGDIVVFHFPVNPKVDFIKRVIGVPGDVISYKDKRLTINGKPLKYTDCDYHTKNYYNQGGNRESQDIVCVEHLGDIQYKVDWMSIAEPTNFDGVTVPEGSYFVMGDNRDNSEDSRYWGFVSNKDLVGKAKIVWFSWDSHDKSVRLGEIGRTF
ncbi:signal peptidase I [Pseudofrancisella aestuarii]|uniref:Signal peptidase I n=1 Tax=Pseudofrancisella aestuarii TaxID=2670347 RepID=A0ABV9TBU9_9GAMM|nr:signal peptidase I [Pseudofrancisella aestuarii]